MIKHQMFIAAALFVGVAIGYFVKDEPIPAEEPTQVEKAKRPAVDKGAEASVRALRRRIAELEKALAEKEERAGTAVARVEPQVRPPEQPRQNWRERMEDMKKNDPERYTQMTNRFAQWRRSRSEQARDKIDFLSSIDTSRMSAGAKKTHNALQELIARSENIAAELQQENLTDERRGELIEAMRETRHEMMRLNAEERNNLFKETARSLGFEGDDVTEIIATIQEIIKATDGGFGPPRRGGGPRGPGGPGGR